jgi:hypothetical protein
MSRAISLLPLYNFMARTRRTIFYVHLFMVYTSTGTSSLGRSRQQDTIKRQHSFIVQNAGGGGGRRQGDTLIYGDKSTLVYTAHNKL